MILICDKQEISLKTISQHLNRSIPDILSVIKKGNEQLQINGYLITKKTNPVNHFKYKYIWDGVTLYENKTITEISRLIGGSGDTMRHHRGIKKDYFVSEGFIISNNDYRGKEEEIKIRGHDGERFIFGSSIKNIYKLLNFKLSYESVIIYLRRSGTFKEGVKKIWKNI